MSKEKHMHETDCDCGCDCCEDDANVMEFIDEDGNKVKYLHIGTVSYKDEWYAVFKSLESEEEFVSILQIVGDEENEELIPVEDEKLLDEVFDEFCRVWEEYELADEAASLDTDYEEGCGCGCKNHDHKHEIEE